MTRGTVLTAAILVVVVGGLAAANLGRDSEGPRLDWKLIRPAPREVVLEAPRRAPIIETITASGTVEPVEEAEIAPQVVGRVVEVHVEDGDHVKKGDLLVLLDTTAAAARLDSANARTERLQSAILQARSNLEKFRRDRDRTEHLALRNVSSPTELLDRRTDVEVGEATLKMAERDLADALAMGKMAEQELSYTRIVAPIDGVISGCDVEVGEVVIAGTTNLPGSTLLSVADLSRMQVRADVDETDVPLVAENQPARVYLQADLLTAIPGRVARVAPKAAQAQGRGQPTVEVVTFETIIGLDSSAGSALRSGMTATVEIEVRRVEDAVSVPVQAVVHRRKKDLPDTAAVRAWIERNPLAPGERAQEAESRYVKVVFVTQSGIARARPVSIGLSDERRVEITDGLTADDRVITGPFRTLEELKDGDLVKEAAPDSSAREAS